MMNNKLTITINVGAEEMFQANALNKLLDEVKEIMDPPQMRVAKFKFEYAWLDEVIMTIEQE